MRKFLLIAATMFGFGCITPSIVFAAPVAGLTAIEAPFLVEQTKKDGYGYKADKHWKKHWKKSRHWDRRRGYSRYYDGPPSHARAYVGEHTTSVNIATGSQHKADAGRT